MASKSDTQNAIWDAIIEVCEDAKSYSGGTRGQMIRDAAVAYRLAAGGQQPGGSLVAKSD